MEPIILIAREARNSSAWTLKGLKLIRIQRARPSCAVRETRAVADSQPELFHPGADFSLQLPGRDRPRKRKRINAFFLREYHRFVIPSRKAEGRGFEGGYTAILTPE